jgi:hypothetical protein
MRIEVQHLKFKSQRLSVETASSPFGGPKLLLNDMDVKREKRRYAVTDDSGAQILIQMKGSLIDPVPTLVIDDEKVQLAEPLRWYEYAWSGMPILLMYVGGALGGLVGGVASIANGRIFRSERRTIEKYAMAGVISVTAVAIYYVVVIVLRLLFWRAHR